MAVGNKGPQQFQGIFDVIPFKATVDLDNAVDAATVAAEITVDGAALGDFALVSFGVDAADLSIDARVTAADTITVTANNNTGGAVNLASTTVTGIVLCPKGVFEGL